MRKPTSGPRPTSLLALLLVLLSAATLFAQQADPQVTPAQSSAQAVALPLPSPGYTYRTEGRRDPFVSLLRRGLDPERSAASNRAPGLSGLAVADLTLKGTMASRDGFVAILLGIDNRTYIARAGDQLLDGAIKTIAADGLVVVQRVNDPLAPKKQREVRKALRQTEEAR